ncbi:MAG: tail fiber domain-containing protein [Bacteroidota bacterium]
MKNKTVLLISILLLLVRYCSCQVTIPSNTWAPGTNYLGWNTTTHDLSFGFGSGPTQYMQLNGNTNPGWLGIGTAFTPNFKLDVDAGDINLNTFTSAYRIGNPTLTPGDPDYNYRVLWHNGDITSIFVGVNAGNSGIKAAGGINNTLMGNNAGLVLTTGKFNTAIGFEALNKVEDTDGNTAVGWSALHELVTSGSTGESVNTAVGYGALYSSVAYGGCALGFNAGYFNTIGCQLVAIGEEAAYHNTEGNANMAIGEHALFQNLKLSGNIAIGFDALQGQGVACTTCVANSFNLAVGNGSLFQTDHTVGSDGFYNTAIGHLSGQGNITGSNNSFLGYKADVCAACTSLLNSSAIGANCIVNADNKMILGGNSANGHNDVKVGIGLSNDNVFNGPRNKLEINADPSTTAVTHIGGSGLMFRQLTDVDVPIPNTSRGVLSVDLFGTVVLVDEAAKGAFNGTSIDASTSKVQLGNDIAAGGADLINDREVPLNDFNIYFTELGTPNELMNNIAIGTSYPVSDPNPARLTVEKTTLTSSMSRGVAGEFTATCGFTDLGGTCIGVYGKALQKDANNKEMMGGRFDGKGTSTVGTYGVYAIGDGNRFVWGGKFLAQGNPATTRAIGVDGIAAGARINIGVHGYTKAPIPATVNYAVYGDLGILCPPCPIAPCPACLPATTPDYAGYFNGDVGATTAFWVLSDSTFKENIQDISDPMDILNQLNPKSYTFKHDENSSMMVSPGTHYGLLSQEVESVLPSLTKNSIHPARYDSIGNETHPEIDFKALNYTELIPFLIAAVKQQEQTIEAMQAQLDNCCNAGNRNSNPGGDEGNSNGIDVELKNIRQIVLNQNFPNPFAEHTLITFIIPSDVKEAQMFFYDNKGTILKTVDITERGEGQINVYAPDLSSGIYKYTLITDGKVFDTKQMVKQN